MQAKLVSPLCNALPLVFDMGVIDGHSGIMLVGFLGDVVKSASQAAPFRMVHDPVDRVVGVFGPGFSTATYGVEKSVLPSRGRRPKIPLP